MKVDFMIIGAQKCGTTSLASQLASHQQICFCRDKEPAFFSRVENWKAGLDAYHALYSPYKGQLCGEASTSYTFLHQWPSTAERLFCYNPNLKLIYIMRQPVDRIVSHYAHNLVRRQVKLPLEDAVASDSSYINISRYSVQIRPYLELFGRDNILLLIFEEYTDDQHLVLNQIARFLNIEPFHDYNLDTTPKHPSLNKRYIKYAPIRRLAKTDTFNTIKTCLPIKIRRWIKWPLSAQLEQKPQLPNSVKRLLWQFVEDDVYAIEELVGRPLSAWRQGQTWLNRLL